MKLDRMTNTPTLIGDVNAARYVIENLQVSMTALMFPRAYHGQTVLRFPKGANGEETRPRRFTDVMTHPDRLDQPLRWRKPRRVFVNSMSDLFHDDVPVEFVAQVFAVMALAPHHTFQILTKRPERMRGILFNLGFMEAFRVAVAAMAGDEDASWRALREWPLPNVWLLTSVEDQSSADLRIPELLATPAAVRGVSYEPALGPVDFTDYATCGECGENRVREDRACDWGDNHCTIDWVIVGGESGPNARTFDVQWARDTIAQCREAGVACFVKQLGANPVVWDFGSDLPLNLKHRAGADPSEWPEDLRVQEWPA